MKPMDGMILTVFFLLEIAAMIALGAYGYHIGTGTAAGILLAIALPLAVAILWGMFLSPKASRPVFSYPARTALKFVVFVSASAALCAIDQVAPGLAFLILSFIVVAAVFMLKLHEVKM